MSEILKGRKVNDGVAEGEALVSPENVTFYGSVDLDTGEFLEEGHALQGQNIKGKVLVFPKGKGSTVGSFVIYGMAKKGTGPIAIINQETETIVATGVILAKIPSVDRVDIEKIKNGDRIRVDADSGTVEIL